MAIDQNNTTGQNGMGNGSSGEYGMMRSTQVTSAKTTTASGS